MDRNAAHRRLAVTAQRARANAGRQHRRERLHAARHGQLNERVNDMDAVRSARKRRLGGVHGFRGMAVAGSGFFSRGGRPELCSEYGEDYYAAFVIDPDGYRIEAVINKPA
jgi:hypothetical protein